jgi:hypothetical protein
VVSPPASYLLLSITQQKCQLFLNPSHECFATVTKILKEWDKSFGDQMDSASERRFLRVRMLWKSGRGRLSEIEEKVIG